MPRTALSVWVERVGPFDILCHVTSRREHFGIECLARSPLKSGTRGLQTYAPIAKSFMASLNTNGEFMPNSFPHSRNISLKPSWGSEYALLELWLAQCILEDSLCTHLAFEAGVGVRTHDPFRPWETAITVLKTRDTPSCCHCGKLLLYSECEKEVD